MALIRNILLLGLCALIGSCRDKEDETSQTHKTVSPLLDESKALLNSDEYPEALEVLEEIQHAHNPDVPK